MVVGSNNTTSSPQLTPATGSPRPLNQPTSTDNHRDEKLSSLLKEPKVGMEFDSSDDVYNYYSLFARQKGFAVAIRSSRKGKDKNLIKVTIECNRRRKARFSGANPLLPRPHTKIGCRARIIARLFPDGKWRLKQVHLDHNHEQSPGKARFYKSNRKLDDGTKRKLELNDAAGIRINKSYESFQLEAGGPSNLSYIQKDCRSYIEKVRRLSLLEGDTVAMYRYFVKMQFIHLIWMMMGG